MEEFQPSLMFGIGNEGVRAKFRRLESEMKEFEPSSRFEMEEFESNSDAWNREWKSSRQVRSLESEIDEFEPSSKLGIGNEGFRAKFRRLESGMEEFELSPMHGILNGGV